MIYEEIKITTITQLRISEIRIFSINFLQKREKKLSKI